MALDVITILLLLAGVILALLGILKAVKASQAVALIGIVLLVFGGLGYMGIIDFSGVGAQKAQTFTGSTFQQPPSPQVLASDCPAEVRTSNQYSTSRIRYRNVENSSESYLAATVGAYNGIGSERIDSTTTNAGGSGIADVSMSNIPNCHVGEIYATVTTGTGVAPSRKLYDLTSRESVNSYDFRKYANRNFQVLGASYDVINILARDQTGATATSNGQVNGSTEVTYAVSGTGTADGNAYFLNTSLGSKGSINFYIEFQVNGSNSVAGAYEELDGIAISYDSGTAAKYSKNSLTLSVDSPAGFSLNKVSNKEGGCGLTDLVDNRNVEACWTTPSLKQGTLYKLRGTLTADLGDPLGTETQPKICFDDRVFFTDADGTLAYKSFSSSGTNQGIGGTCLNFVNR